MMEILHVFSPPAFGSEGSRETCEEKGFEDCPRKHFKIKIHTPKLKFHFFSDPIMTQSGHNGIEKGGNQTLTWPVEEGGGIRPLPTLTWRREGPDCKHFCGLRGPLAKPSLTRFSKNVLLHQLHLS